MPNRAPAAEVLERMMERSELRIESAARKGPLDVVRAASRLLETAHAWQDWSTGHRHLLRPIACQRRLASQSLAIRRMALSMIHRKAPFEFLRDGGLRGAARHRFLRDLFGDCDYARTVVREHRSYVQALCSYVCVDTLCTASSMARLHEYERCYTDFWQARARAQLATAGDDREHERDLAAWLQGQVREARNLVLDSPPARADELTLEELRRPVGDTVRLRVLPPWLSGAQVPASTSDGNPR